MLECATLNARTSKLDFSLGPALPTTKLSFAGDLDLATTPSDERAGFDWSAGQDSTPVPRRAQKACRVASTGANVSAPMGSAGSAGPAGASTLGSKSGTLSLKSISFGAPMGAPTGAPTLGALGAAPDTAPLAAPLSASGLPDFRLRLAESSPSLSSTPIGTRVPDNWRTALRDGSATPKDAPSSNGNFLGLPLTPTNNASSLAGSPQCLDARKVRRTQSMFPSSEQFMYLEGSAPVASPSSAFAAPALAPGVPTFSVADDMFPRLDAATLVRIMDGEFRQHYDSVQIVDCRFEYEYAGGHIAGARNVSCKQQLEQALPFGGEPQDRVLVVFHCEYSAYRGPLMATHLRQRDRQSNTYPTLTYPNIAVLDGGYSGFFLGNRARCEPQNYIGMNDNSYKVICEREMERFRTGMRLAKASRSVSHLPAKSLDLSHSNMSTPSLQRGFVERRPLGPLNF